MTFAAIPWLSISINLLLVIFVIVCLLMTLLILMQRPKQEGLGAAFGGGVTDQVFGARTTNVLQRGTVYLGSLFFLLALILAILIGHQNKQSGLADKANAEKQEQGMSDEPAETPAAPAEEPKSLTDDLPKSLLDELPEPSETTAQPEPAAETQDAPDAPVAQESTETPPTPEAPEDKPSQP